LSHLCLTLHEISNNSKVNKMTSINLGVVFSPNILSHDNVLLTDVIIELKQSQDVVETLIREAPYFFSKQRDTSLEYSEIDEKIQGKTPREVATNVVRYSTRKSEDADQIEKNFQTKVSFRKKSIISNNQKEEIMKKRITYLNSEFPNLKLNML
jgi:hypothetical protein